MRGVWEAKKRRKKRRPRTAMKLKRVPEKRGTGAAKRCRQVVREWPHETQESGKSAKQNIGEKREARQVRHIRNWAFND